MAQVGLRPAHHFSLVSVAAFGLRACIRLLPTLSADDLRCSCGASAGCDGMSCIASDLRPLNREKSPGFWDWLSRPSVVCRGWLVERLIRWKFVKLPFEGLLEWDSGSDLLHTCQ